MVMSAAKCHELCFELLPDYLSDLVPSDYFLFPNLKKWLTGQRSASNEEVITETNAYFAELDKLYYTKCTKKLKSVGLNVVIEKVMYWKIIKVWPKIFHFFSSCELFKQPLS